jgi:hypothetical protein
VTELPARFAEEKLRRTSEARLILIEEHSAAFKWLVASFLAVNGGGLLALGDLKIDLAQKQLAGSAFWFGIVCALGIAWQSQVIGRKAINKLSESELLWLSAIETGELDVAEGQRLENEFKAISVWPARAFGWASLLAFSVGVFLAGASLQ